MAGLFDDLTPAAGAVSFDDLIAKPKPRPQVRRDAIGLMTGALANVNRGLGIGDELAAAGRTAGNVVTGRVPLSGVVEDYRQSMGRQRLLEDTFAAEHPVAAPLAKGVGNALTVAAPGGTSAEVMAAAPRMVNAARGAGAAALAAGTYALADRGTLRERLAATGAAMTNPVVLGLGAAGGALGPAKPRMTKPISEDVIALREKGVPLTPGQMRGGVAKAAEDALTSTPILGTAIQDARSSGVEGFNHAVANEALAPVGLKVPETVPAGHETVAYVEKQLGGLYDKVIPNRQVLADPEFKSTVSDRLGEIAQDMTEEGRKRLAGIIDQRVTQRFGAGDAIDGETFQRIQSGLSTVKARFSASQDVDQRAIGDAIGVVQEELRNAAARQDPAFAAQKSAIDTGWALFKRMQGAAASPGAEAGVFTPAQYGGAARRADRSVDKGATARGSAVGQEFANSARAVLPNKVPDSGTANRGAWAMGASAPGAMISGLMTGGPVGAAGVAAGYGGTLAGLKLAAGAYSPKAIELANAALDARISRQAQAAALEELRRMSTEGPKLAQLYQKVSKAVSRAAGVIPASRRPAVEVSIEGRPDLGVGQAYGNRVPVPARP